MVATGNVKAKRKNGSNEVKTEPEKKYLKKSDLVLEYQALQQKFDAFEVKHNILVEENATHIDALIMLEETVKLLELKVHNAERNSTAVQTETIISEKLSVKACETQTEDVDAMRCQECEYSTQDICDLGAHVIEVHSSGNDNEMITCHYCEAKLKTKGDLLIHRKKIHREKVSICRHKDECWFIHDTPVVKFKCAVCNKEFPIKTDFMKHRKENATII